MIRRWRIERSQVWVKNNGAVTKAPPGGTSRPVVCTCGYAKNGFTCVSRFPALLTRLPRSRETRRMRVGTHLKSHCCSPVFLQAARYAPKAKDLLRNFSTTEERLQSTRLSLSLSLSALTALHLLVFSSKSTSNLFEGGRQKSSRENGRKKGDCAKNVQKICEEDRKYPKSTLMIFEWNKFLFHNFIYFYREDIRSTETTRSRYMENFHRMEENFKYWREIFEHFRVTGGHPLGT